jgi:hypothetical protein
MKTRLRRKQSGIALLIVIMALLVVTAVAAGMIIYSNSETKVDANYRDAQVALFAAKAGLEEARNRMLASSTNQIPLPCLMPNGTPANNGCTPTATYATYIVGSNNIQPWTSSNSIYNISTFDSEFMCEEFLNCSLTSFPNAATCCQPVVTNASYSGPAANPIPYQWVRINLKTNATLNAATGAIKYVNNSLSALPGAQVMFDSTTGAQCVYNTASCCVQNTTGCNAVDNIEPVYELTSFAVTPSGTIRMLQDDVSAYTFDLSFPSSLTLPGPIGSFNPPNANGYCMDGNDTSQVSKISGCSYTPPPAVPGCSTSGKSVPAVGVTPGNIWNSNTTSNQQYVTNQIPCTSSGSCLDGNYMGSTGTTPSVANISLPSNLSDPAALEQELSAIQQNSNVCLGCSGSGGGSYTFSNLDTASGSLWGSCGTNCGTTPQITYVNGNLDISGQTTGSGILVVTGNLTYDGNSSWNGIILVVGDGLTTYEQNGGGNGQFNGAVFVASITNQNCANGQTQCYGPADFTVNGGGGNGIYYNSCWINNVQKPTSYLVLSSKEISQ